MKCFKVGGGFLSTMTAMYRNVKGGLWRRQKFLKMLALVGLVSTCGLALSSCSTVMRITLGNIPEIGQDFRDMAARMDVKKRASLDPDSGLSANLSYVSNFAEDGGNYVFEISNDQAVTCIGFRYTDTSNVTITIRGIGENITIYPDPECHQFLSVSAGATLILDNITVRGFPDHPTNRYPPLFRVYRNGTLEMLDGSAIIANTSKINSSGAAVSVSHGGTFHMKGGIISGNSSFIRYNPSVPDEETAGNGYGGGVEVAGGGTVVGAGGAGSSDHALGTFIKTGGIITGYADDPENGNAVRDPNGNPVSGRGHALYIRRRR